MELNFTRWLSGDLDIILLYNRECYSTLKSTCKVCTVTVLIASLFSFLHALVIYDNFPKQRRCQYSQKLCSNVPNTTRLTVVFRSALRTLLWHTYLTSSGRSAAYGPYKRFDIRLSPWSAPLWSYRNVNISVSEWDFVLPLHVPVDLTSWCAEVSIVSWIIVH